LLLPGPELSRGFSRSASRPWAGLWWRSHPMVLLTPVGVAEAALAPATGPAIHASGSIPDIRLSSSLDIDAVQTRTMGAAAVELLLLEH